MATRPTNESSQDMLNVAKAVERVAVMRAEEAAAAERAGLSASKRGTYTMRELLRGSILRSKL